MLSHGKIAAACAPILLVLQPVVFFRHVLINPTEHIPYDIEGFHLPLIGYIAQCVRQHVFPLGTRIRWAACRFMPIRRQGRYLFYWVEAMVPLHMALAGLFTFLLLGRMGLTRAAALMGASIVSGNVGGAVSRLGSDGEWYAAAFADDQRSVSRPGFAGGNQPDCDGIWRARAGRLAMDQRVGSDGDAGRFLLRSRGRRKQVAEGGGVIATNSPEVFGPYRALVVFRMAALVAVSLLFLCFVAMMDLPADIARPHNRFA